MNMKQFKYIYTLANEGSFSSAAAVLDISQPALSQYIKKTEMQLGTALFERTNEIIRLTDAGKVYIETGRQISALQHQMKSHIEDITNCKCGTIRVGLSAYRSVCLMPSLIKAFKEEYPGYEIILSELSRDTLVEAAEHGEYDLCITTLPVNENIFNNEKLFEEEIVLAIPMNYKKDMFCGVESIEFSALNNLDFVVLSEKHPMQHELNRLLNKYNININRAIECTSLETLISMVSVGLGVALVPITLKALESKNVEFIPLNQTVSKRDIVVIYGKDYRLNEAVKRFKELMHIFCNTEKFS